MFGVKFRAAREAAGFSQQELADKAQVSFRSIVEIEQVMWPTLEDLVHDVSAADLSYLAYWLELDEYAIFNGQFKPAPTVAEVVEHFDPGGTGTHEERLVKLYAHAALSRGRVREILKLSFDGFPSVKTTHCECLDCKYILEGYKNG